MDWQKISIQRLRDYEGRKKAVELIPEQVSTLEMSFTAIRSASMDGMPIDRSGNHREDALLSNIAMRDELENNLEIAKREVGITESGLAGLSAEQRKILQSFYINRPYRHIDKLCAELHVEKTKLYHMKDEALKKFTLACYGVVEL